MTQTGIRLAVSTVIFSLRRHGGDTRPTVVLPLVQRVMTEDEFAAQKAKILGT